MKPAPNVTRAAARRPSCLGVLLVLIVLVGAINLALIGVRALAKPGNPLPGTLLYATRFTDGADPDWYQYNGALSAQIANGTLLVTADEPKKGIYSSLNYAFRDFDVRVVARIVASDDPYNEYGILFRYQDDANYDLFEVSADGNYHVVRVTNGKQEDLSARHPAPGIAPGANHVNDLRVVGKADQFAFYVNGQQLTLCPKGADKFSTWNGDQCLSNHQQTSQTLTDPTFATGRIAFGAYENAARMQVAFSNVVIYSPTA